MEDRHLVVEDLDAFLGRAADAEPQALFGVYDGHGGIEAAEFSAAHVAAHVAKEACFAADPCGALGKGVAALDEAFLAVADEEAINGGATACTVLIRGSRLHIAWLGDTQAMLCRAGAPVTLMDAHKPERDDERKRIEGNGGSVVMFGTWRVNGQLSVARAIGDRALKKWVIGTPDTATFELDGTEECVLPFRFEHDFGQPSHTRGHRPPTASELFSPFILRDSFIRFRARPAKGTGVCLCGGMPPTRPR
jgi:protein phosphatase 1E